MFCNTLLARRTRPFTPLPKQRSATEFTLGSIVSDRIQGIPSEAMVVGDHLTFFNPVAGRVNIRGQILLIQSQLFSSHGKWRRSSEHLRCEM